MFIVAAAVVARNLSNPLRYLSKQVKRFERGDLGVSFELDQHNEIGVLARGLSGMVASVAQLLETVRSEQEKKRQIELQAMQAQIQPHFLYNTLSSIKHLIDMNERQRASTMVSALTSYFRISISKGREIIPVREEMEHVRSYLMILNIRYSHNLTSKLKSKTSCLSFPFSSLRCSRWWRMPFTMESKTSTATASSPFPAAVRGIMLSLKCMTTGTGSARTSFYSSAPRWNQRR